MELICRGLGILKPALFQDLPWGLACFSSPQEVPVRLLSTKDLSQECCVRRLFLDELIQELAGYQV